MVSTLTKPVQPLSHGDGFFLATVGPPTFAVRGLTNAPRGQKFVVAAVDPDAPTPQTPTSAQIRHFLGGDFTLGQSTGGGTRELVSNTPPVSGFLQPTPPAGSDAHRYVSLSLLVSAIGC